MNGPQRTAVSRKELRQKRKLALRACSDLREASGFVFTTEPLG